MDDLLNACRIHGEWRWEKALQKQVLEHGDPEMGKHIVKTSSGIGLGYVLLVLLCYWLVR